jgi:hypothetical protein
MKLPIAGLIGCVLTWQHLAIAPGQRPLEALLGTGMMVCRNEGPRRVRDDT